MNTKLITETLFHKFTCVLSVILSRKTTENQTHNGRLS